jgi:methyltransferase
MDSQAWYLVLLGAVVVERIAEMVLTARNARWSFARGGVETGREHFPAMVALHVAFLVACSAEVLLADRPFVPWLGWPMLALVMAAQALRWWCIGTLGPRWNSRVIVVPGLPPVRRGPYRLRWLRHPNYVAVVVELVALPLVHTAWVTALAFSVLNAAVLRARIRVENAALASLPPAATTPAPSGPSASSTPSTPSAPA